MKTSSFNVMLPEGGWYLIVSLRTTVIAGI